MRTPLAIMVVLALALLGLDLAFGEGGDGGGSSATRAPAPVATIARRVEVLRDLRYRRLPVPQRVSAAQARRDGLSDFDSSEPPRAQAAEEELLELLGLLPARSSLRKEAASLFEEGVAGYYDPRTGRLKVVAGAGTSTPALTEITLAHELTHALEDQRFHLLDDQQVGGGDDGALARLALVEGTATEVMTRYGVRYVSRSELLAGALGSAFAPTGDLPPFEEAQTLFPYVSGQAFVEYLLRRAGGRWALVDDAEKLRPPVSTEQVMHPERYLRADEPKRVRIAAAPVLGKGWTRVRTGTWGEYGTRELLADGGGGGAEAAAAGWGGDRWELWRRRPLADGCPAPCRAADALVLRWRWDTPRDQREFAARLAVWRRAVRARLGAGLATATGPHGVTLALAPDDALARRLARAG
jgi:hypothetical protein